jgi:hypothetical protein
MCAVLNGVEGVISVALLLYGRDEKTEIRARIVFARCFKSSGRLPGPKYRSRVVRAVLIILICLESICKGS